MIALLVGGGGLLEEGVFRGDYAIGREVFSSKDFSSNRS